MQESLATLPCASDIPTMMSSDAQEHGASAELENLSEESAETSRTSRRLSSSAGGLSKSEQANLSGASTAAASHTEVDKDHIDIEKNLAYQADHSPAPIPADGNLPTTTAVPPPAIPAPPLPTVPPITSAIDDHAAKEEKGKPTTYYPEGGLRGWLVVFGAFSGMFACFGLMNTLGVLQAYMSTHQLAAYSPSSIGWLFSIYIFLSFFCGLQIGPIFDAKGPRWLVFLGSVVLVAGVFGLAESTRELPACSFCKGAIYWAWIEEARSRAAWYP